jgi:hypothetical protein
MARAFAVRGPPQAGDRTNRLFDLFWSFVMSAVAAIALIANVIVRFASLDA